MLFAFGPAHRAELAQKAVLTGRGGAEARALLLGSGPPSLDSQTRLLLAKEWPWLSAPATSLAKPPKLAGNALSAGGPIDERSAP